MAGYPMVRCWLRPSAGGCYRDTLADVQVSADGNRLLVTAGERGTKPGQWATGSRRPARVASAAQRAPR